jgi:hypothetical protein
MLKVHEDPKVTGIALEVIRELVVVRVLLQETAKDQGGHQGTIRMVTMMMMTHKVGEVIMTGMDIGDKVLVL